MFFNINLDSLVNFKNLIKAKFNWKFSKKIKGSAVANGKDTTAINGNVTIYNQYFIGAKNEFSELNCNTIPPEGIEKKRYAKLEFDFATKTIDMEESIKNLFKFCNKICLEKLADDKKYRILHNLNDAISKLSYADIEEYKKLYALLQPGYYQIDMNYLKIGSFGQQNYSVTMFKNLGLIDIVTDIYSTNSGIKQAIQQIDKKINSHGSVRPFSVSPTTLNNDFLKASLAFTKEGKILIYIIKAIEAKSEDLSKIDLENIYAILNL